MKHNIIMHYWCYNVLYIYYCLLYRYPFAIKAVLYQIHACIWRWTAFGHILYILTPADQLMSVSNNSRTECLCYGDWTLRDIVTPTMHYDVVFNLVLYILH